jgi:hypothetical protein
MTKIKNIYFNVFVKKKKKNLKSNQWVDIAGEVWHRTKSSQRPLL